MKPASAAGAFPVWLISKDKGRVVALLAYLAVIWKIVPFVKFARNARCAPAVGEALVKLCGSFCDGGGRSAAVPRTSHGAADIASPTTLNNSSRFANERLTVRGSNVKASTIMRMPGVLQNAGQPGQPENNSSETNQIE